MIARTWAGATTAADADAYMEYLRRTGLSAYSATPGNLGAVALRRVRDGRAEFLLLSFWDGEAAIRRFAGSDPGRAVFFPADDSFLVERDLDVEHFDVVYESRVRRGWIRRALGWWWDAWQGTFRETPNRWRMAGFR